MPSNILALSLVRIDEVSLVNCYLTPTQLNAIFKEIVRFEDLRLKKLVIRTKNVSSVAPTVIQQARTRLEELTFERY